MDADSYHDVLQQASKQQGEADDKVITNKTLTCADVAIPQVYAIGSRLS